jgi:hypothetical protein
MSMHRETSTRARVLECKSAQPTPAGAACESAYQNAMAGVAPLNLGCRIAAASCGAMDLCEVRL